MDETFFGIPGKRIKCKVCFDAICFADIPLEVLTDITWAKYHVKCMDDDGWSMEWWEDDFDRAVKECVSNINKYPNWNVFTFTEYIAMRGIKYNYKFKN